MFTLKNILLTLLFVVFIGIIYKYFTKPVEPMTVSELTKQFQGLQTIEKDKQAMDTYCFSAQKGVCRRRGPLSNNDHAQYLIGKSLKLNWPKKETEYEIVAVITGNPYGTRSIGKQGKGADTYDVISTVAKATAQLAMMNVAWIYARTHFSWGKKDIATNILSKSHGSVGAVISIKGHVDILLSDTVHKSIIKNLPKNTPLRSQIQGSFDKLKDGYDKINILEQKLKKNPTAAGKKDLAILKKTLLKNMTAYQDKLKEAFVVLKRPSKSILDRGGPWVRNPQKEQDFLNKVTKKAKKTIRHEKTLENRLKKIDKMKDGSRIKAWRQKKYDKKIRKIGEKTQRKVDSQVKNAANKAARDKKRAAVRAKALKALKAARASKAARAARVAARALQATRVARASAKAAKIAANTAKLVGKAVSATLHAAKFGGKIIGGLVFGPVGAVIGAVLTIYDVWAAYRNDIKLMTKGDYCNRSKDRPATKDVELVNTLITEIRLKRKFPSIKQFLVNEAKNLKLYSEAEKIILYRKSIEDELKKANNEKFGKDQTPKGPDPYKLGVIDENTRYTMYLNNFEQILNYLVPYKYLVDVNGNVIKDKNKRKVKNPNYEYLLKKENRRHLDNVVHCTWDTLTQQYSDGGVAKGSTMNLYNSNITLDQQNLATAAAMMVPGVGLGVGSAKKKYDLNVKKMEQWDDKKYSGKFLSYMRGEHVIDKLNRIAARSTLLKYMSQELFGVLAKNRVIYDTTDKVLRLLNDSGVDDGRCYYHLYDDIDPEEDRDDIVLNNPNMWCPEFTNLKNDDDVARTISLANLKAIKENANSNTWKNGRGRIIYNNEWKKVNKAWGAPWIDEHLYKSARFSDYEIGGMYAPYDEKTNLIDNNKKFEYDKITNENLKNGWKANKHRRILKYFYNPISVFMPASIEYDHKVRAQIKKRLKSTNSYDESFFKGLTYSMPVQGNNHDNMLDKKEKYRWDVIGDTFLKKPTRMSCAPYITNVTKPNIDSENPGNVNGAGNNPSKAYMSTTDNQDYDDDWKTPINGRPIGTNELMWPQYYVTKGGKGMYRCMKRDLSSETEIGRKKWKTGNPTDKWKEIDEIISNAPLISSMYTYNLYTYTYKVGDNGKFVSEEECVFGTGKKSRHRSNGTQYEYEAEKLENANVDNKHINMVDIQLQIKAHLFDSYEKSSKEYDRIMTCKFKDKGNIATCAAKQRVKCTDLDNDKISKQFDDFKKGQFLRATLADRKKGKSFKITSKPGPNEYKDTLNFLKCYRKVLNELEDTELKHLPNINEHDYLTQALIDYTISSKDSKYCNEVKKQMSVSNSASYTLNPEAVEARANTLSKVEGIKLRENLYNCTKEIGKDIDEIYN